MRRLATLLLTLLAFASCKHSELTFEELQKAKWDSLAKGIYYISKEDQKGVAVKMDSIELKLKGVSGKDINSLELSLKDILDIAKEHLSSVLRKNLADSRSGYLKVNFTEMWKPEMLTGMIYLRGDYSDPFSYHSDSAALKDIPGILSCTFISKEEGKKKYLKEDGNNDWDKILDANPLPNGIEIVLEKKDLTEESLKELENKIKEKLTMASTVSFPTVWAKKSESNFFFEYLRR